MSSKGSFNGTAQGNAVKSAGPDSVSAVGLYGCAGFVCLYQLTRNSMFSELFAVNCPCFSVRWSVTVIARGTRLLYSTATAEPLPTYQEA